MASVFGRYARVLWEFVRFTVNPPATQRFGQVYALSAPGVIEAHRDAFFLGDVQRHLVAQP